MDAYTGFAEVYDNFMDNIPYEEWAKYLLGILKEYGIDGGLIADLGCGTGSMTELLARAGYDMIGIDNSVEMLEIARDKMQELGLDILYLMQDMREFELYGTVNAVVSICDSMNYILEYEDLVKVIKLVNNYLEQDGYFIFDLNTPYKYREQLGDQTIAEDREEISFIWDNYFDQETGINEYDLSIFIRESDGRYRKYEETHYQRAYKLSEIQKAIEQAGMEYITAYDAFTKEPPKPDSERIYIIAKEKWQEGKKYKEC